MDNTTASATTFKIALAAIDLRLRAGDEGWQAIDAVGDLRLGLLRLRLRLVLRLWPVLAIAAMLARLLVIALIGLLVAVALAVVAHIGLRLLLLRHETGLLSERREAVTVILAFVHRHVVVGTRLLLMLRLVLPELLLGSGDEAEIVFGVLIVVLGGDRISGRARIASELDVFFGDVGSGTADLDVGSVGFVDPGHRILAAPVLIVVVIVPSLIVVVIPLIVVSLILLVGAGYIQLYESKPTFGANCWADYFGLFVWGFGVEASRSAVTDWLKGFNLSLWK